MYPETRLMTVVVGISAAFAALAGAWAAIGYADPQGPWLWPIGAAAAAAQIAVSALVLRCAAGAAARIREREDG